MLKIIVNKEEEFAVELGKAMRDVQDNRKPGREITINGKSFYGDILATGKDLFHILDNNKSYRVEVIRADPDNNVFTITINGNTYKTGIQDFKAGLLAQLGIGASSSKAFKDIKAPMPGLVIDIQAQENQDIVAGDTLMVLEAMKMENILKSPGSGIIKKICIKKGDAVEKNQILIEME